MTYYCTADGTGPHTPVDWPTLVATAQATDEASGDTAAMDVLGAYRVSIASHVVRNGNPPRTYTRTRPSLTHVDLGDQVDEHGGRLASVDGEQLRCPECLAPVRAVL
jgi:hypothetical protein